MSQNNNVDITKDTYNKISHEYDVQNSDIEKVQELLNQFLAFVPSGKVLDIGCASGRESQYLSEHGLQVIGTDISDDFISIAKRHCPKGEFLQADMRELTTKFPPNTFDGIWANASFLHIPKSDALTTLQGFNNILKPNAVFFLSVMKGDFDALRANSDMNWPERHFSDYREEELQQLLHAAGFTTIKASPQETSWGKTFLRFYVRKASLNHRLV